MPTCCTVPRSHGATSHLDLGPSAQGTRYTALEKNSRRPFCRSWTESHELQGMKVEVLYFDGCPTYEAAAKTLRAVLAEEGVEAVVDRLGLDRFAIFGAFDAGPVVIAYAARHPERVSRLILWCSW